MKQTQHIRQIAYSDETSRIDPQSDVDQFIYVTLLDELFQSLFGRIFYLYSTLFINNVEKL